MAAREPYVDAPCEACGGSGTERAHNPAFDQNAECLCGHPYYRHFDTYDNMRPIGCKYCPCFFWEPPSAASEEEAE